jgi:hypothetical protein
MVFYLLLNTTNALTQEYFQPPFVIILMALGLMASRPATDPPTTPWAPAAARERDDAPPG